ncbi:hypothetical protein [Collimonas silvisoli]|uniref:hypothetical protein n=1 Tax=Collimonas silvisoli TaxID=2825884 RepID=UPI001B8D2D74|nr:hypothetical protein [Collimonas silvisoli]
MPNKSITVLKAVDKPTEVDSKPKIPFKWLNQAFILAILTPTAYLIGVAFYQSYMRTLRVAFELYPKTSTDYFLYAFEALLEFFPSGLKSAGTDIRIIAAVFGVLVYIALMNIGAAWLESWLDSSEWMKRRREKVKMSKSIGLLGDIFLMPTVVLMAIYYIPIFITLLMLIPVLVGQSAGRDVALRDKAGFEGGCTNPKDKKAFCTQVLDGGKPVAVGFVVEASEKFVALIADGVARSIPIKDKEFVEFRNPQTSEQHALAEPKDPKR